jgi:hypothetical protein
MSLLALLEFSRKMIGQAISQSLDLLMRTVVREPYLIGALGKTTRPAQGTLLRRHILLQVPIESISSPDITAAEEDILQLPRQIAMQDHRATPVERPLPVHRVTTLRTTMTKSRLLHARLPSTFL